MLTRNREHSHNEEYKNLSAHQIVPKLADKGIYLASESTFYRVLKGSVHDSVSASDNS